MSWFNRWVENKLGGYKHSINNIDIHAKDKVDGNKSVCVIGAGLAGIASAYQLSKRGFKVDLHEKEGFIGGKVGSWKYNNQYVEHGFHAFFKQYYNLKHFLDEIDCSKYLQPISDYEIRLKSKDTFSFIDIERTPIKNILSLRKKGVYTFMDMLTHPKYAKLKDLLSYHPTKTFEKYDHISFQTFADDVGLNTNMRIMFNTFARAFFAEPEDISMAELIKGFHFYFLSNDLGLVYDVLDDDFEYSLLQKIRESFDQLNVKLHLNQSVNEIGYSDNEFVVNGSHYNYCVLATESVATQRILSHSTQLRISETIYPSLKPSGNYAVLRLWINKVVGENDPFFIFVDRFTVLDSITFYHHMEKSSKEYSEKTGVGIYELHAYSVPKSAELNKETTREVLLDEFYHYFPQLKDAKIVDEYYQYRSDFTSFHTHMNVNRPQIKTEHPNLFFAGDWVKMDNPLMLMEAAYTSGCIAANYICRNEGVIEEQLYSVPPKGIFG